LRLFVILTGSYSAISTVNFVTFQLVREDSSSLLEVLKVAVVASLDVPVDVRILLYFSCLTILQLSFRAIKYDFLSATSSNQSRNRCEAWWHTVQSYVEQIDAMDAPSFFENQRNETFQGKLSSRNFSNKGEQTNYVDLHSLCPRNDCYALQP
jgi:hypothetical protein